MLEFLQYFVLITGLYAFTQAIKHAIFFSRSNKSISRAMVWLLVEQIITSGGTIIFAGFSLMSAVLGLDSRLWNATPPTLAIALRTIMFSAMIHSTHRMSVEIRKIQLKMAEYERDNQKHTHD